MAARSKLAILSHFHRYQPHEQYVTAPRSFDVRELTSLSDVGRLTDEALKRNVTGLVRLDDDDVSFNDIATIIETKTGRAVECSPVSGWRGRESDRQAAGDCRGSSLVNRGDMDRLA